MLLTDHGQVVATIVPADELEAESMLLSVNPKFQAILERSRRRLEAEGGLSSDEVRERLGLPPTSTPASSGTSRWRNDMVKPAKNTVCLWYDNDAENAARFYAETFPDSFVGAVHRAPGDFPSGKIEDVLTVEFTVMGIPCLGLNGGPAFKHDEAFSFQVATVDQAETDRYWNAIVGNGGQESECGWCKDKWGLSWQITPIILTQAYTNPDRAIAKRAFDAMMTMKKINIAAIEAAIRG
jgi:2-polyprenyl-6-hydroxyphenyl methylase/3-demethylubiquinone-9 3-methyltransferase